MDSRNVYRIIISTKCQKTILKSPKCIQKAVDTALAEIACDPYNNTKVKPLQGDWKGFLRYRLGDYRIIYHVDGNMITVYVDYFGPRGDVYK